MINRLIITILACMSACNGFGMDYDSAQNFGADGKMSIRMRLDDSTSKNTGIIVISTGINGDNRDVVHRDEWMTAANIWGFALVGTFITGGHYGDCSKGSGKALEDCISDIAKASHRPELATLPIITVGFSQGGAFSYSYAWWNPKRTIAFVNGKSGFATDGNTPGFDMVPGLLIYSEHDHPAVFPKMKSLLSAHYPKGAAWCLLSDWGFQHEPGDIDRDAILFIDAIIRKGNKATTLYGDGPDKFGDPIVQVRSTPANQIPPEEMASRIPSVFGKTWQSLATSRPLGRISAPQPFVVVTAENGLEIRMEDAPADATRVDIYDNSAKATSIATRPGDNLRASIKPSLGVHAIAAQFLRDKQILGISRAICVFATNQH